MKSLKNFKGVAQLLRDGKLKEFPAFLGNLSGTVKADSNNNVYVTFWNGEVMTVNNQRVPNVRRLPVIVGPDPANPKMMQVLRSRDVFPEQPYSNIPLHAKNHEYGELDQLWVRGEQFVTGLIVKVTGLIVHYTGGLFFLNNAWHVLPAQDIDLESYVPETGAVFVVPEVDENSEITILEGDLVASRLVLAYSDIPSPSADKKVIGFAIKLYAGQIEIIVTKEDTDILDLRWTGYSSGGSGSFITDWENIQHLPSWVEAIDNGDLIEITEIARWSALEGDSVFPLPDLASSIKHATVSTLEQDPLTYSLTSDGLNLELNEPLDFDAIVTCEYVLELT